MTGHDGQAEPQVGIRQHHGQRSCEKEATRKMNLSSCPTSGGSMTVQHDPDRSRFLLPLSDGEADLTAVGARPQGGFHLMTTCPYVQAWLRKHPDERRARRSSGSCSRGPTLRQHLDV